LGDSGHAACAADRGDPDRLAGPSDVEALTDMLVLRFS
jgi:hypothetical protein